MEPLCVVCHVTLLWALLSLCKPLILSRSCYFGFVLYFFNIPCLDFDVAVVTPLYGKMATLAPPVTAKMTGVSIHIPPGEVWTEPSTPLLFIPLTHESTTCSSKIPTG